MGHGPNVFILWSLWFESVLKKGLKPPYWYLGLGHSLAPSFTTAWTPDDVTISVNTLLQEEIQVARHAPPHHSRWSGGCLLAWCPRGPLHSSPPPHTPVRGWKLHAAHISEKTFSWSRRTCRTDPQPRDLCSVTVWVEILSLQEINDNRLKWRSETKWDTLKIVWHPDTLRSGSSRGDGSCLNRDLLIQQLICHENPEKYGLTLATLRSVHCLVLEVNNTSGCYYRVNTGIKVSGSDGQECQNVRNLNF